MVPLVQVATFSHDSPCRGSSVELSELWFYHFRFYFVFPVCDHFIFLFVQVCLLKGVQLA